MGISQPQCTSPLLLKSKASETENGGCSLNTASQPEQVSPHHRFSTTWTATPIPGFAVYPWYRAMRESQPVSFDPQREAWLVFRYQDVVHVLSESATFSSATVSSLRDIEQEGLIGSSIISMDPPRHRQLRALVGQLTIEYTLMNG